MLTLNMLLDSQETQRLMAEPVPGISAVPDETNARYFHVVVAGKEALMPFADFHGVIIFRVQVESKSV